MKTLIVRKFAFALTLLLLTASVGKAFSQNVVTGGDPEPQVVTGGDPEPQIDAMEVMFLLLHSA